jgi:SAM-dependent methyltransferase
MSEGFDYQQVVFGAGWDLRREDRNLGGLRLDLALKVLESHPGICTGCILEAGCGVGRFTAPLSAHLPGTSLFAFDLSGAAVAQAAACSSAPSGSAPSGSAPGGSAPSSTAAGNAAPSDAAGRSIAAYTVADTLALPYASRIFDAVLFFDLLEHLDRPDVALAEFARVTRTGGLLHGYVPCEGQPPTLHWLLGRWVHPVTDRHAGHIQHFRHAGLVALVQQAGFEVLELRYSYHLLGQMLDIATFAVRETVFRRRSRGLQQPETYYDRSVLGTGGLSRAYRITRRAIEAATYLESELLRRVPWALGLHLTARRTSKPPAFAGGEVTASPGKRL